MNRCLDDMRESNEAEQYSKEDCRNERWAIAVIARRIIDEASRHGCGSTSLCRLCIRKGTLSVKDGWNLVIRLLLLLQGVAGALLTML